jgi:hypothetical protein
MSEEAKMVEPEQKEKAVLSAEEQTALVEEKMAELRNAGVDVPAVQMNTRPPAMIAPPQVPMGMGGPMTSLGAPPMVAGPPTPLPHMPDTMDEFQKRRSQHQQRHPGIKYDPPQKKQPESQVTMTQDGLIQLDPITMLEIELITAELRAAEAEEKLAMRALRDAREKLMALHRKQSVLMSNVTQQIGIDPGKSIRLVDKEQRLCRVED